MDQNGEDRSYERKDDSGSYRVHVLATNKSKQIER